MLLLLFIATTVIGALLSPHPHGPQPSALGDFSVPTAQEGRAIPVVFGTCMIKGGNTVWWGDLASKAIKVGGGILSFGMKTTTGYKYFLGCQFMLCHGPVDALVDIQADAKSIPRSSSVVNNGSGSENYLKVVATGENLFGGVKAPGGAGGISGTINFYRGLDTQQPDDYLSAKQGRIVLDQSGIGYTYSGIGNGTITAESAGTSSLDETITITAIGIDGNVLHATFGKMRFSVVGSLSGSQQNNAFNSDGSKACWADQAFSCPIINMTIQTGSTQYVNGDTFTIVTQHSHIAPAYRKLCYAVFKQLYVGSSNYLKPLAFVVRRCPDPLAQGSSIANLSGDANPALAIYEVLTNVDYGLGIPALRMGSSWATAAVTLATEGLGISMQFDTQASADQLIGEILRHCDGLIYTDPATGLWEIVLARGDYDPTLLPVLMVDNVLATPDFSRGSWSETSNLVTITFTSRSNNFNSRVVRAYDGANIEVTREVRSQTIDFKGISSETAAALVAIRVLKTLTYPLSKIKLVANRSAWQFRPGGLFRFTWVPLGIVNQVFRITRIGYGELVDGKITIDAVEDIFGINSVAFLAPPSSGWVNPAGAPVPNLHEKLVEMPYDVLITDGLFTAGNAICMAARDPSVALKGYQVWRDDGSGYADTGIVGSFCPWAKLSVAYPAATVANDPVGFTVDGASAIDMTLLESVTPVDLVNAVNLAIIDEEIISWETVTLNPDGSYTISGVLRGLMDTVEADHAINAPVFFFSVGASAATTVGFTGIRTINVKMLPTNTFGTLPIGSASASSLTLTGRQADPYPMGNVCMQSLPYGTRRKTIYGSLVLTWSQRSLTTQAGQRPITEQDHGDIALPFGAGFAYDLLINGSTVGGAALVLAQTLTITGEQRATLGPANHSPLTVMLKSYITISVTTYSFQEHRLDVIFTGFGLCFGEYFGGFNS